MCLEKSILINQVGKTEKITFSKCMNHLWESRWTEKVFVFVHVEKIQTQDFKQVFYLFLNPKQNRPSPKPITMMKYLSSKTNTNNKICMKVVTWHVIEKS